MSFIKVYLFGILAALAMVFSGCATLSSGPSQEVSISTSNGKKVIADVGGYKVELPATVQINRSGETLVKVLNIDNPNYEDTQLLITGAKDINGSFWLNFVGGFFAFLPGIISTAVDVSTGSMYKYSNPDFVISVREKK